MKIIEDMNLYVLQLILYLPYNENMLCDEVYYWARDVKDSIKDKDSGLAKIVVPY